MWAVFPVWKIICFWALSGLVTLLASFAQSYLVGNDGSHPISEAKQPCFCPVLRQPEMCNVHFGKAASFQVAGLPKSWLNGGFPADLVTNRTVLDRSLRPHLGGAAGGNRPRHNASQAVTLPTRPTIPPKLRIVCNVKHTTSFVEVPANNFVDHGQWNLE